MTCNNNTTTPSPPASPSHQGMGLAGGLFWAALILSHRLRNGLGLLGAAALAAGVVVAGLATAAGSPDTANAGGGLMMVGAFAVLVYLIASVLAWLLKIVTEDVKADFLTDDTPATETDDDEPSAEPSHAPAPGDPQGRQAGKARGSSDRH